MKQSTGIIIALAAAAGIGLAALLLLKRPEGNSTYDKGFGSIIRSAGTPSAVSIQGDASNFGNTYENCTFNNYAASPAKKVQRLPMIINGDDAQTITSYIPGGY